MTALGECSPGNDGNPHADRPNWQPAETIADYFRNCSDGLETYTHTRAARLLGQSRTAVWRQRLAAQLPQDLFDYLLHEAQKASITLSTKALAGVAFFIASDTNVAEIQRCPHCGEVLRVRRHVSRKLAGIVVDWLERRGFT